MAKIPSKVATRISTGIKRFQPILASAKSRDLGESDTVMIIVDMLAEIFGYDKFSEITSEHAIKGTYCDLATKLDGALQMLIEVKAIGLDLKEQHVKQAIDYAANQGVDWVVLTNGVLWRVYKVTFAKPIDQELVIDIDFCTLNPKSTKDLELLFLFCKEGWVKSVLGEYQRQKQALNRFFLGAILLSDPIVQLLRRELHKLSPGVKVERDEIRAALTAEVLKRDVTEGEQSDLAKKKVAKAASKKIVKSASKHVPIDTSHNFSDDETGDVIADAQDSLS
jgi:hypothetical protein